MANLFAAIAVPANNGAGAAVNISTYGFTKRFSLTTTNFTGCINIEISNDGVTWVQLVTLTAAADFKQNFAAQFVRAVLSGWVRGSAALAVGGVDSVTQFAAIAVPAADGTGAVLDVSAYGEHKTIIYDGGMEASIVVEAQLSGGYTQVASFSGRMPAVVNIKGAIANMRVTVAGFVVGSPGVADISVCGVDDGGGSSTPTITGLPTELIARGVVRFVLGVPYFYGEGCVVAGWDTGVTWTVVLEESITYEQFLFWALSEYADNQLYSAADSDIIAVFPAVSGTTFRFVTETNVTGFQFAIWKQPVVAGVEIPINV